MWLIATVPKTHPQGLPQLIECERYSSAISVFPNQMVLERPPVRNHRGHLPYLIESE